MIVNCISHFHMKMILPANVYEMAVRNATAGAVGLTLLDIAEDNLSKAAVALGCQ
jgi:hypothetical protein